MSEKPYLTFYREHNVSPVRQDISDMDRHFQRRQGLYRQLGLPESFVRGRKVIEFGPGSGHNSIYTASLLPSRYVLVDGNPTGLRESRESLAAFAGQVEIDVRESDIQEFDTPERFDLAICEGVIPGQADPASFVTHIANFVTPGGLLLISCQDSVPFLADALRRFAGELLVSYSDPLEAKLSKLLPFFEPHLRSLPNMSRRHEDWVIDNVIQHWPGKLFSLPEAIRTLRAEFDIYATSPSFIQDWRWYKDIQGQARDYSGNILSQYAANIHNFLDHDRVFAALPEGEAIKLIQASDRVFELYLNCSADNRLDSLEEMDEQLSRLGSTTGNFSLEISGALSDAQRSFRHFKTHGSFASFGRFEQFWGRGQQYASFIRKSPTNE